MAEIADSDSFDLLSSSPPGFVATPTVSDRSTVSDVDSIPSDSLRSTASDRDRFRHGQNRSSLSSSSFASETASEATSPALSAHSNPHLDSDDMSDWSMDMDVSGLANRHHQSYSADSSEESLFVDDFDEGADLENLGPNYFGFAEMDQDNAENQRDELVGMEVEESHNPQNHQRHQRRQPRAEPEVIDLTGDVSPPQAAPQHSHSWNMRRRRSQRNSPPRLSRSDASYVGERTVIDLVSDSDSGDPEPVSMPPLRRNDRPRPRRTYNIPPLLEMTPEQAMAPLEPYPQNMPPLPRLQNYQHIQRFIQNIPIFRLLNNPQGLREGEDEDLVMVSHRNILPADNPIRPDGIPPPALAPIHLDYNIHPFANPPQVPGGGTPKPAHEPPEDTRQGFTRNTAEDVIAICPSCEQELAYEDGNDGGSGTSSKKARSKKDKAEHHFWAVKACGHVYCRKCFDNRKPVGKNPVPVGFRPDPSGAKNKMLCAVDDCESEVSSKNVWVGIFM
ncbi:hypothetical protein F4820DRAFT_425245 [Hypoxylon rubiginosum]|uniref:Uncharacterized protein n=1 Tax=Hypoxylon rubiginosum TaxID=110542 RepID=A0ACB9YYY5_9PEZI|nr:hypothetical protein F4820DRAFT_425245 [Hypoxylon rubiginosum]